MLSLGKIYAGPTAAQYYTDQLANGREEYYAGEGEAPGWWTGGAAAAAGLTGEVAPAAFAELLSEGGGLGRPIAEGQVAGWDLTFRAPKSVSVLWGVADRAIAGQLREAHDAAVAEALGYLEEEACWARRGKGGQIAIRAGGFVAAAFRHRASRDGDPLLHTHVVAVNRVPGADGRWTAPDARHLHRQAKTAGYAYQAVLRAEVTERLGLEWGRVENGVADLAAVPRPVIEHFSQRRRAILEHQAAHGGRSAASAQVAALETRRSKQAVAIDRLREQWRARAAEHGLDARAVNGRPRWPCPAAPHVEDLTAADSSFGRADVIRTIAEAQPEGARVADLVAAAEAVLADANIVALDLGPAPGGVIEPRFTTRELVALERELLTRADVGRATGAARVAPAAIETAVAGRNLSDQQHAVVADLCGRGDAIAVVRAAAGTGKTYALDAAREAWQAGGVHVEGVALSARAARELQDQAAIPSGTIAQLQNRLDAGAHLPRGAVLVVDEAGMVGTRDLARLAEATTTADAKLVLVGDDRQLPEIQAGGAFRALADRLDASRLTEVRRQRAAWDRDALDQLRSGDVERWARIYRDKGRITVADNARATRQAIVNDWSRADGDALMIAARRDDVRELNGLARAVLQADGRLGSDELVDGSRAFATGDRVIGTMNDRAAGILNGQRGRVDGIDAAGRLAVALESGTRATVEPDRVDHGYAITAHRAQGATVDRTFVLGSEELYREWGYTALSRHRDEARFYIAHGDLDRGEELPSDPDYLVERITDLMTRGRAKGLALYSLPDADRTALEVEHDQLRADLEGTLPRRPRTREADLSAAASETDVARVRGARLREEREALRWHERRTRAVLDEAIERNDRRETLAADRADNLAADHAAAVAAERAWADGHPDAIRFLAVDAELAARYRLDHRADRRLEALGYREPAAPLLDRDDHLDLGL